MNKLKNCPFCDCEMEVNTIGRDWWRIQPIDGHEDLCPMAESEYDCTQTYDVNLHIDDWNMRANGLVSIADKLPELNQYCLVYTTNKGHRPINFTVTQYTKYGFECSRSVTHWMPLPGDPCVD